MPSSSSSDPDYSDSRASSSGSSGRGSGNTVLQQRPRENDAALHLAVSRTQDIIRSTDARVSDDQKRRDKRQSHEGRFAEATGTGSRSSRSRHREAERYLSEGYRNLLNETIECARARSSGCDGVRVDSSQIGASLWHSQEKDALFRGVELAGCRDLSSLCQAVPTKSQSEIRAYLLLLQDTAVVHSRSMPPQTLSMSDIPAAVEVSKDCDIALNLSADAIASYIGENDIEQEQKMYGDHWLIDETVADEVDEHFEQNEEDLRKTEEQGGSDNGPSALSTEMDDAAATLLSPSALLELSRTLFMNNLEDPQLNWHTIDTFSDASTEPALFRSALEDLHNLSVSITRRLVHATIFQAMTRIRAGDSSRTDWAPIEAIREVDVQSALDVLDCGRKWKDYWATVPRRCQVGVFSDSKKYADGRRGTKVGHQLTYDEVEAELGLKTIAGTQIQALHEIIDEGDVDEILDDSDMFTDQFDSDDGKKKEKSENEDKSVRPHKRVRKRKRARSPRGFFRAETEHLEQLDQKADAVEELTLWKAMDLEPPRHVTRSVPHRLPMPPGPTPSSEISSHAWRDNLDYEAEWEHPIGLIEPEKFQFTGLNGCLGRKRRKLLLHTVAARLEASEGFVQCKNAGKQKIKVEVEDDHTATDDAESGSSHEQNIGNGWGFDCEPKDQNLDAFSEFEY